MGDDTQKSVDEAEEEQSARPSRRTVVTGIAAALAATAAKLLPEEARADDGQPVVLGSVNTSTNPTVLTSLSSPPGGPPVLVVDQPQGQGPAVVISAAQGIGLHVPSQGGAAILATWGPGSQGVGVSMTAQSVGSPTGVASFADFGVGVKGVSGVGVQALAVTMMADIGVAGLSDGGAGVVGVSGRVDLPSPVTVNAGVLGVAEAGAGVIGVHTVVGSPAQVTMTALSDAGVAGVSQGAVGVLGLAFAGGPAGVTFTADPMLAGLRGVATDAAGVGVLAENPAGVALRVVGRLEMQTAGEDVIPTGQQTPLLVANPAVTAQSHVTVTITVEPSPKGLRVLYIERVPGIGFAVHLKGKPRKPIPFTWSVVEPSS